MKEHELPATYVRMGFCSLVRAVSKGGIRICIGRHGFNVAVLAHPSEAKALGATGWYDWRVSDAKQKFAELIASVEAGSRVQLKRHGDVVAILVGWEDYGRMARSKAA